MQALTQALAAAAVLVALSPAAGAAKLYKWVDENGNVTYSQTKPPDAKAEEIKVKSRSVSAEQAREQLDALQERNEEDTKNREFQQSHATATLERDERMKKNCEIARQNLRVLKTNSRIKDTSAEEQYFLDEEAIKSKIDQAEQQIEQFCGSGS